MKKIIALLLVLVLGLTTLAGCGGAKLTGRYDLVSMTSEGEIFPLADYIQEMKDMFEEEGRGDEFVESDYQGYIEFIDANTCKLVMFGESADGTYTLDGKSIEIVAEGETMTLTLDGSRIILDDDGEEIVFEKK